MILSNGKYVSRVLFFILPNFKSNIHHSYLYQTFRFKKLYKIIYRMQRLAFRPVVWTKHFNTTIQHYNFCRRYTFKNAVSNIVTTTFHQICFHSDTHAYTQISRTVKTGVSVYLSEYVIDIWYTNSHTNIDSLYHYSNTKLASNSTIAMLFFAIEIIAIMTEKMMREWNNPYKVTNN